MVLPDFATGTILAFVASICFGTQTSFAKIPSVISCKIRMEVFNIYFIIGVAIICLLGHLILYSFFDYTIKFSLMGIISALLLYIGELFALLAVQSVGVAYGMSYSVLASAVASIIIQYVLGQEINNIGITILGLVVVTISVISCAFLKKILSLINVMGYHETEKTLLLMPKQESVVDILSETAPLIMLNNNQSDASSTDNEQDENAHFVQYYRQMIMGFIYASIGGICYCSVPLPTLYVDEYSEGIKFSLSFGIGCLIILPLSILNVALLNPIRDDKETKMTLKQLCCNLVSFDKKLWHFKKAGLPGIGAGFVWGIGNLMGICTFLYLDYVIVMVYVQFHIIVALLWGICLWKEITQTIEIIALSVLTLTLIAGCVLVTYGVYGHLW